MMLLLTSMALSRRKEGSQSPQHRDARRPGRSRHPGRESQWMDQRPFTRAEGVSPRERTHFLSTYNLGRRRDKHEQLRRNMWASPFRIAGRNMLHHPSPRGRCGPRQMERGLSEARLYPTAPLLALRGVQVQNWELASHTPFHNQHRPSPSVRERGPTVPLPPMHCPSIPVRE
jgi:alkylated DNA nucleotide flippase Atl1